MHEELVKSIGIKLKLDLDEFLPIRKRITIFELISSLISTKTLLQASLCLKISKNTLKKAVRSTLDSRKINTSKTWDIYLLSVMDHKKCFNCLSIKPFDYFYKTNKKRETSTLCKECEKIKRKAYIKKPKNREKYLQYLKQYRIQHSKDYVERTNRYKASKIQRIPKWANLNKIKKIYENCPKGYHVDHIIPLNGKNVSGLHVENNLQYLPARDNIAKHNRFES